jgi:hypothetical protein
MLKSRRPWSEDDVAKLKSLAGRRSAKEIAAELGRTAGATVVEASKLKISLDTRGHLGRPANRREGQSAGAPD